MDWLNAGPEKARGQEEGTPKYDRSLGRKKLDSY